MMEMQHGSRHLLVNTEEEVHILVNVKHCTGYDRQRDVSDWQKHVTTEGSSSAENAEKIQEVCSSSLHNSISNVAFLCVREGM